MGLPGLVGPMACPGSYSRSGGLLGSQGGPFARFAPSDGHAPKAFLLLTSSTSASFKYGEKESNSE
ncbi:hypothetical protein Pyn_37339 [Prunus yedoensis var. nudiflora]|uniref:Uncharacterized protein n=1 Tax=Prunus yedoensis var. nudiflora TaxID=2094558 RepID=A0A314YKY6_PRUYE|nr:hypothetical protein Pyn_37339 [Prunus yedoensis var. nudiflora]